MAADDGRDMRTRKQWEKAGRYVPDTKKAQRLGEYREWWTPYRRLESAVYYPIEATRPFTKAMRAERKRERDRAKAAREAREREERERADQRGRLGALVPQLAPQLARGLGAPEAVVIDCETTGLDAGVDELLQVSVIDAADGRVLFDSLVRPRWVEAWPEAEAVNGISPAMVAGAPSAAEVAVAVGACVVDAREVIGYNTGFDLGFLAEVGVEPADGAAVVDVMEEFAPAYGEWADWCGYKWQPLTTAAGYYGFDWSAAPAHSSLGDCLATLHVYRCLRDDAETAAA